MTFAACARANPARYKHQSLAGNSEEDAVQDADHLNAPVADFPVRKIIGAHHFVADLTLPYGRVLYDYNKH